MWKNIKKYLKTNIPVTDYDRETKLEKMEYLK